MKSWIVTFTLDREIYQVESIEGETFTEAYVRMMLRHHGAIVTDIKEG